MKAVYLIISLFVAAQTSNVSAQMNYKLRNTENAHVTIQPAPQQAVPNGYYVVSEPQHPLAPTTRKPKGAIDSIIWRNKVRCGSDMSVNSYAHQEDGVWFGIDADICRVIAEAIIGDNQKIEMVNVGQHNVTSALDSGKIDIMLSGGPASARIETSGEAINIGLLYYDYQALMVHTDDSDDIESYRGKKICVSTDSEYFKNFDEYNANYNLGITYLTFGNMADARQAFLLNRCQLMTASSMMLNGINNGFDKKRGKLLPHKIALRPTYAYVERSNNELRVALKWIFNALYLAEQYDITTQNLPFYATNDNIELKNLLGEDPQVWSELNLKPTWVRKVIASQGNYNDIFNRDLGLESEFKLDRIEGKLVKDGGTIYPIPFL